MRGSLGARASAFVTVVLLHVFAIGAFWYGLAESGARPVPDILEVRVIDTDRHREPLPPPPLPQVDLNRSQAIQIAAPEVAIPAADPAPPLQVEIVESGITPTPPRGPAAAPAPRPGVKPKAIYVPGGWQRYPAESLRAKETGAPTITICISDVGAVDSVEVTESSGFPRLDQAAVGIGREARFKPAMQDGKPVSLCLPYRIKFGLYNF